MPESTEKSQADGGMSQWNRSTTPFSIFYSLFSQKDENREAGFKREVQHLSERPPQGFESEGRVAADD
jgi:hypothetical protein